jgi:hypothetical protein
MPTILRVTGITGAAATAASGTVRLRVQAGTPGLAGPNTVSNSTTVGTLSDLTGTYSLLGLTPAGTGLGRLGLSAEVRSLLGATDAAGVRDAAGLSGISTNSDGLLSVGNDNTDSGAVQLWDAVNSVYLDLTATDGEVFCGVPFGAPSLSGSGAGITGLNAENLASGTIPAARLPIASAGSLGGVRVGSGLAIDGSGILSASGGGAAAAGSLTGTTLAANVVSSSLTSVGTLTALSVRGAAGQTGQAIDVTQLNGNPAFRVGVSGGFELWNASNSKVFWAEGGITTVNEAGFRSGNLVFGGSTGVAPTNLYRDGYQPVQTAHTVCVPGLSSNVGLRVVGESGQTADLFQVRNNSNTVLASINPAGVASFAGVTVSGANLFRLGTYTVATLPSASANAGAFAQVTDSNSTTNGATVAGGGADRVPVFSNGTNWIIK